MVHSPPPKAGLRQNRRGRGDAGMNRHARLSLHQERIDMVQKNTAPALQSLGPQRVYKGDTLREIVFPIGGLGAGFVGLTGLGGLKHVSIANRPNFEFTFPDTFPLIYAKERGHAPVARVLRAPLPPPYSVTDRGNPHLCFEGVPHMDACAFRGEYPFAWIDFTCKKLPVKVSLEAYNPFIPSSPDDSGYPAAIFRYTVKNIRRTRVDVTIAWSFFNCIGELGEGARNPGACEFGLGQNVNELRKDGNLRGIFMYSKKWPRNHPRFGSIALVTPETRITVQDYWRRDTAFSEAQHDMWDVFSATGRLPFYNYGPTPDGMSSPAALGILLSLAPAESRTVVFYLTWYFPNFEKYWEAVPGCCGKTAKIRKNPVWKNYYAAQFKDAFDVARKLHRNEQRLRSETQTFHKALFSSTFPPYVTDAVASQMAILKTSTVLRLPNGAFYGFEGSSPGAGCCEGSCTHVWNYQQALPFLFPSLERSMRSLDYRYNMREKGSMCFRLQLPLGRKPNDFHPCVDGQLGGIIKTYRDWKISGDDAWLRKLWPSVKKALEFAWTEWDPNKDGVIDGIQHNTYDIEFAGPNPLSSFFYFGALTAAAEMAEYLGESNTAAEYRAFHERGRIWIDANLFNGEYYEQQYDPDKTPRYQFGKGCLSDALLGQWMAGLAGLGYLADKKHIVKTLRSILKYNWRADLRDHACPTVLVCAFNDEAGLVACSWPKGGKPRFPFSYFDEVWAGIEYQVASHCIMEGLINDGLKIVKAVRDRHDGYRRNPWDQFECCGGHHYSRIMSSYGLLTALSGFTFDKGAGRIGFSPAIHKARFQTFWALDGVWGTFQQRLTRRPSATFSVLWGCMPIREIGISGFAGAQKVSVTLGLKNINASIDGAGRIALKNPITLSAGMKLVIRTR